MKKSEDLCLIVMDNCKELGLKVNEEIKKLRKTDDNFLIPVEVSRFTDGEGKVTILETIRGKDVYILSDTHNYSITYNMYGITHNMSPDEHYQDIKRVISAIMGHAKSIRVVMPFLYASRQHRRKSRESLDCALALQELKNLGVDGIVTFDAHDPNVQNAIPTLPFDNFFPTNELLKTFLKKEDFNSDDTLVVSPDTGAMDRARYFADVLRVDVGMFYKRRDISKVVNGHNPIVAHEYLGKDVVDKNIIIVDDMIDTAGTLCKAANQLKEHGARRVFAFASHGLFSKNANQYITDSVLEQVVVLNTIPLSASSRDNKKIVQLSVAPLLADTIRAIHGKQSVSEILERSQ